MTTTHRARNEFVRRVEAAHNAICSALETHADDKSIEYAEKSVYLIIVPGGQTDVVIKTFVGFDGYPVCGLKVFVDYIGAASYFLLDVIKDAKSGILDDVIAGKADAVAEVDTMHGYPCITGWLDGAGRSFVSAQTVFDEL